VIEFGEATAADLEQVISLLRGDALGRVRETAPMAAYRVAFDEVSSDPNQLLVVGRSDGSVVATLQLTIIPNLSRGGTRRAQLEGVRVDAGWQGRGLGRRMVEWAIDAARDRGCGLVQLTTDHRRPDALRFYESLGFVNTHHGMKLTLQP
jgi:GNAT superfamily N-acetyltransferase